AQRLQGGQVGLVAQEAHRAVGKGKVGPARMAAAEGTQTVALRAGREELLLRDAGWHSVIDRHRRAQQVLRGAPPTGGGDPRPLPHPAERIPSGTNREGQAVEFRIEVRAFAKEEGVAGAVGNVHQANGTVLEKDAVPSSVVRTKGPFAGVAAITAQAI